MKFGKQEIDLSLITGVFVVLTIPLLLRGFDYDYFTNVKFSSLGVILLWCIVLVFLYFMLNLTLMIISTILGRGRLVKYIVKKITLKGDEQVLNFGCTRGLFAIQLARRLKTGKVTCVDIWQNNGKTGNKLDSLKRTILNSGHAERIHLAEVNPKQMPFDKETFDLIINNLVLHQVKPYNEREKVLKEMARVLKPGGMLIIIDLQYTREYKTFFNFLGWKIVARSPLRWQMFPPVRVVTAIKPLDKEKAVQGHCQNVF